MSSNNFILISEQTKDTYKISENDAESNIEIKNIGTFDSLRTAVDKVEEYISNPEIEVEYGIRFSLNKIVNTKSIQKNFDSWNKRKKEINEEEPNFYYEREIRWCSLGINIGFEQDGTSEAYKRPVLIIKGFSRHVCLIIPLTTSKKKNPYHFEVGIVEGKEAFAILSQIRLIDTKRLHGPLAVLGKDKFNEIKKAIKDLL